ncbi:MAG: hypothetical protein KGI60_04435 [Patescibacteria group bacterium]|nr:hypothetical protein [Patescibacteria group bacterium]
MSQLFPDVILALSFGQRKGEPCLSNIGIAEAIKDCLFWAKHRPPILAQWEVAECLKKTCVPVRHIVREHRVKGKYLDSYECLDQMAIVCRANGWKVAFIAAHPHHRFRCQLIAEKLGLTTFAPKLNVPYDPQSTQPWTRSPVRFLPREAAALVHHKLFGLI